MLDHGDEEDRITFADNISRTFLSISEMCSYGCLRRGCRIGGWFPVSIRCGSNLLRPKSGADLQNRPAYDRINCDAWPRCTSVRSVDNASIRHCTCDMSTSSVYSTGEHTGNVGSAIAMYWPAMIVCDNGPLFNTRTYDFSSSSAINVHASKTPLSGLLGSTSHPTVLSERDVQTDYTGTALSLFAVSSTSSVAHIRRNSSLCDELFSVTDTGVGSDFIHSIDI